jgi:hypothetical protein
LDAALASVAENANDTPATENEMDTSLADLLSKL